MKILKHDSDSILYEKVKSLRSERTDIWRCIHISLAEQMADKPDHIHFSGRIASQLLANDDGYIFLCDDGDIFILFKGALMPVLRRLSVYFEDFHPDRIAKARNITVFDLGQNWKPFFELCRSRAYRENVRPGKPLPAHHTPLAL
jgi:hypothetical protein